MAAAPKPVPLGPALRLAPLAPTLAVVTPRDLWIAAAYWHTHARPLRSLLAATVGISPGGLP